MEAHELRDKLIDLIDRMGCTGECCSLTVYIDLQALLTKWGGSEEGPPSGVMVEGVVLEERHNRPIILIR